jgi:hypothetical protein
MTRHKWHSVAAFVAFALILAACKQGSSSDPTDSTSVASDDSVTIEDLTPEQRAELLAVPDVPFVSPIEVSPEIVEAGELVTLRGHDRLSGPVTLTSNGATLTGGNMANGIAEFTIPIDAGPGSYFVEVVGANGEYAGGKVRITDGPGLWIHTDRSFVSEGSPAELTVEAFGLPDDAVALLFVEDTESGTFATLVPASDGRLVLVRPTDPKPLATFLGQRLTLPDVLAGTLQVLVVEPGSDEPKMMSNEVRVGRCDEGGAVRGTTVGSGSVSALWVDGGFRSAAASTAGGGFELSAGPGRVMVTTTAILEDGSAETLSRLVNVPCGGVVDVDESAGGVTTNDDAPDLEPDTYQAEATGDVEFRHVGLAVCALQGEDLSITLLENPEDTGFATTLDIYGFSGTGSYQADMFLLSPDYEFSSGSASITLAGTDGGDFEGLFEGDVDGEAGSVHLVGAFRCTSSSTFGAAAPNGANALLGAHEGLTVLTAAQTGIEKKEICRNAVVVAQGDSKLLEVYEQYALVQTLAKIPRLSVISRSLQNDWAEQIASEQVLLGAEAAETEGSGTTAWVESNATDFLILIKVIKSEVDSLYTMSITIIDTGAGVVAADLLGPVSSESAFEDLPGFTALLEKLAKAAICIEVAPPRSALAAQQIANITSTVLTLDGQEVSGAEVKVSDPTDGTFSPDCGSFDRTEGTTNSPFEVTYTAADDPPESCSEYPRFTATWDGPTGRISTDPERDEADARIDVESEWEFSMQMELPSPEGPLLWDYEGSFVVDDDGFISGAATGNYTGLRSCEVRENGVLTFKEEPVEVTATWENQVHGDSTGEDSAQEFDLLFLGYGWEDRWPALPEICGLLNIDGMSENVLRFLAYQPDNLAVDGIRIEPELGRTWIFIVPELDGTITVKLTEKPGSGG